MQRLVITLIFATLSLQAIAEERVAIAFYDVGRLYDTILSNFYNDKAYTPKGRNHWNTNRYRQKIERITATIDSMRMPIVALLGVENEVVVRDIVGCSDQDYSYAHRDLDYYDGLDFALLYYGDQLFIKRVHSTYHTMVIEAEVGGDNIALHFTRVGAKLRLVASPSEQDITIAWGRLTRQDLKRLKMQDQITKLECEGYGDTKDAKGWRFQNRIGVRTHDNREVESGVYITEWLLDRELRSPLDTLPLILKINSGNIH